MERWSPYQDANLGTAIDQSLRLANILSEPSADTSITETRAVREPDGPFATGRFRSCTICPFVQYFDSDFTTIRDLQADYTLPRSICVGTIFEGRWCTAVNGKRVESSPPGTPAIYAYGEEMRAKSFQPEGCRIRSTALLIGAEFVDSFHMSDEEPCMLALASLLKAKLFIRDLSRLSFINYTFLRMQQNPYRGKMADIYMQSLGLSAIVELASFLSGESTQPTTSGLRRIELAQEAKLILDQRLASPPTAEELARLLGTNQTTLRHQFKETFGISIMAYVTGRRLEAAQILLREGTLQIAEIAYRLGYSEPTNFAAAYRRYFGRSPKADRFAN